MHFTYVVYSGTHYYRGVFIRLEMFKADKIKFLTNITCVFVINPIRKSVFKYHN